MKRINIIILLVFTGILAGCSRPQKITLKDNTVIQARDEVKFNKKTGFVEYEDIAGKKNNVNSEEVLLIEDL